MMSDASSLWTRRKFLHTSAIGMALTVARLAIPSAAWGGETPGRAGEFV